MRQNNNRKSFLTVQIIAAFIFAIFFGCRVSGEKNGIKFLLLRLHKLSVCEHGIAGVIISYLQRS